MTYRPINQQVIIKRLEKEEVTTASGLIVSTEDRSQLIFRGEVLAVDETYAMDVVVGDVVLYSPTQAIKVSSERGEEAFAINYKHLLAVVEG